MDKIYIKFIFGTDYEGTEFTQYIAYDENIPDWQLDEEAETLAEQNAELYEHLALNDPIYNDDDDEDDILCSFYEGVYYWWERVTKEEYEENT